MRSNMRGQGVNMTQDPTKIGLPARPFLYTLDQLATLISVQLTTLKSSYIFYEGRSTGVRHRGLIAARNIAPKPTDKPEWRVAEREFIRWLKHKGFKVYEVGVVSD